MPSPPLLRSFLGDLLIGTSPAIAPSPATVVIALLLALAAPILAGLWIWRRSILRDRAPQDWFARVQAIHAITLAGWVLWMIVFQATQAGAFIAFGLGHSFVGIVTLVAVLGFVPTSLALMTIARRVIHRLRGFDPLPGGAGVLGSLRATILLVALLLALTGFSSGHLRLGVFALLTTIVTAVLWPAARGPMGRKPQSLSSGALRDRLYDLAQRAGVKLRGLYVVPMRRERMANAFAMHGGAVLVADELLDRLSRREVDAVLAHEITHLKHQHPIRALLTGLLSWALIAMAAVVLGMPYGFPLGLVAFWLTHRAVARRFEFAADAGATALTGDAEGLIAGLGALARLNDVPLAWDRGWNWLVTHPTTEARGLAIARRAGLAPARAAELLERGLPSLERYGERERPGEERVFSTAWKAATSGRLGLTMIAASVIAPIAALALARASGVALPHPVVIVTGAVLALAAMLFAQDQLAARVVSRLEPLVRSRLAKPLADSGRDDESFVALAPDDRARIYEGFLDWDLGLLSIEANRIRYRGEQSSWELERGAIRSIELGAAGPSWIPAPRVVLRWLGPEGERALALRPGDCRTVRAIAPAARALASRLESWRSGAATEARSERAPDAASLTPAAIGAVTSRAPAEAAAPRDLPLLVTILGTLTAAGCIVLGLDFWRGVDVVVAALVAVMALRWPAMTARDRSRASSASEPARRAA
jgi:Zn-dependent protease with chaperone function